MSEDIRVIIADDHPLIRTGVRLVLTAEPDIKVVGEAGTGEEARLLSMELNPHIVLLDLSMPGPTPQEMVKVFRDSCPDMKVIVLSAFDDEIYVQNLINAGIAGYVLKDEASELIVSAIRTVMKGATWFSKTVMERFLASSTKPSTTSPLTELTSREQEILLAIARGQSNAQIALALHLAEQTVRNYTSRIYEKLEISSRAEAIIWAYQNGMVTETPTEGI
jgi:two-component system response regulator DegU